MKGANMGRALGTQETRTFLCYTLRHTYVQGDCYFRFDNLCQIAFQKFKVDAA